MNELQISRIISLAIVDTSFAGTGKVKVLPEWGNEGRGDQGKVPEWTAISEGCVKRLNTIRIYL